MKELKYAVIGTGAIGGFYGGMLAKAGRDVHFLFHHDYDHVVRNGLKVDSVLGNFQLSQINAYPSSELMPPCDVILVCLKTTQNGILKEILPPLIRPETIVILIQNGLNIEKDLADTFPSLSIGGGMAFICSRKEAPGHVIHLDYGKLTIGSFRGNNRELLNKVCNDFSDAGLTVEFTEDLLLSRWKKLVWNIPYNGLCVIMNASTEQLMNHPATYKLLRDLMQEVTGAARACGFSLSDSFVNVMLESTRLMKPYAPSMKLDFDSNRPMEIGAIYTAPLTEAQSNGFRMPGVQMLEQQLLFLQDTHLLPPC